jgi:F0F1-type ATP synthase epsilon subunit
MVPIKIEIVAHNKNLYSLTIVIMVIVATSQG